MNILYVMNSGNFGGMEQHVLDLATGMVSKGHRVFVWCKDGQLTDEFKKTDINVTLINIKYDIDPIYIFKLSKFINDNHINIVHSHELKASTNALIAGFISKAKVKISHVHTPISEWQISKLKKIVNVFVYSFIVNIFATCEIALTPSRKKIKIKEGIHENKLIVVDSANAIKFEEFNISNALKSEYATELINRYALKNNSFIWGFVSRISAEKGHYVLVQGFNKFLQNLNEEDRTRNVLIISGGGPLEEDIKKLISNLNLEKQIIVTGKFSEGDKKKFYSIFNVFIHPSLAEGFGIVLIEAMASMVPVLASDLEVFKEVSNNTINYFKTADSEDLSKKMLSIYNNYENAIILSKNAFQFCQEMYSMDKFINDYEKLYIKLLN